MNLEKFLQGRIKHLNFIHVVASKYFNDIEEIVRGLNPTLHIQCKEAVEFLTHIVSKTIPAQVDESFRAAANNGPPPSLQEAFEMYEFLGRLDRHLDIILQVLDNAHYLKVLLYNMSASYSINIRESIQRTNRIYELFQKDSAVIDHEMFHRVFEGIKFPTAETAGTPTPELDFIMQHERSVNKFTIALLQYALRQLPGGVIRRQLELIVERQKDDLLQATRVVIGEPGAQGQIVRYGLCPSTRSMPLEDLLTYIQENSPSRPKGAIAIGVRSGPESAGPFDSLATTDAGVVLLTNVNTNAVEFDLRGLIDMQYINANGLKISPVSGLTKKVLMRYDTARKLPTESPSGSAATTSLSNNSGAAPIKIINGTAGSFYVIETINGTQYRLLGVAGMSGSKISNLLTPRDRIIGLLNGVTTRPSMYNFLQEETILSCCFDPKFPIISADYIAEKTVVENSDKLKGKIVESMLSEFTSVVDKGALKSPSDFRKRAIGISVRKILSEELKFRVPRGRGADEYSLTYISRFEALVSAFVRELERKWEAENIPASAWTNMDAKSLREYFLKTFADVTRSAADSLDRDNSWTEYDKSIKEYFLDKRQAFI
jgi:hypothetical protein